MLEDLKNQDWKWWPLFPLYPYGSKKTLCRELIPNKIWSFEQIQGIYYVAVPVRMTLVKLDDGLMLINPLPPTNELINELQKIISIHGKLKAIVLPTASGLEHKIGLPSLLRIFDESDVWICPGQWSFPINLPLDFLGIPAKRTKVLLYNGVPFEEECEWTSLGPINLGLGRFQEISCFHKPTSTLHVTDAIVGIDRNPPEIFDYDPTPLLFHSRERGDEVLKDTIELRKKGWARLVLFASYLKPGRLKIPSLGNIFDHSFKKGLINRRSHFGIYPFLWDKDWQDSLHYIMGENSPKLQIAPVLKRLIFPRSREILCDWLESVKNFQGMKYLISAHYSSPISFNKNECDNLLKEVNSENWHKVDENSEFLYNLYQRLYKLGIIPEETKI